MFSGLLCPRYAESYRGTIYVCQPDPAFRPDRPAAVAARVVVFPHMVIPLFVGRPRSIRALEVAMEAGKSIMLVAQSPPADDPTPEDVYEIGCVAGILQMLKLPDGTVKVLVEGTQRARINTIEDADSHFTCQVTPIEPDAIQGSETEALRRAIVAQFEQYVKLNKKIPPEILTSLAGIDDAGRLADTIAAHLPLKLEQKQKMLEIVGTSERLEGLLTQLETEIDILQVEKRIRGRVKKQMEKSQRDYYLNEQVKAIQKELGEGEEGADIEELEKKIIAAHMPKEARKKADAELKAQAHVAHVRRSHGGAQLHRYAHQSSLEEEEQDQQLDQQRRDGAGQRPLRPREGQGTHP